MLKYFITSKTKRKLLKLILTNPDRSFYIREAAMLTNESPNAVRRELNYLAKAGLLKSFTQGNQRHYSVIKDFPFYPELQKFICASIALND